MRDAAPMTTRPAMLPLVDIADELGVGAIDPAAGRAQLLALELDTGEFDLPTLAIRAETRGLVTGYIVARGQLARAAVQQAISQLPRVEIRVLALMWHLAERWGHVTPGGLALTLGLTHA